MALLGNDETGEPHLDQVLPERRIVPRIPLEDLAQARRGALVLEELANGLLEKLLFFRDVEVHLPELLSA
jgi:hypothetical protein